MRVKSRATFTALTVLVLMLFGATPASAESEMPSVDGNGLVTVQVEISHLKQCTNGSTHCDSSLAATGAPIDDVFAAALPFAVAGAMLIFIGRRQLAYETSKTY